MSDNKKSSGISRETLRTSSPQSAESSEHPISPAEAARESKEEEEEGEERPSNSPYLSVDPAPATPASVPLPTLRSTLLDEKEEIFARYRALFGLRNKGGAEAVAALGEAFKGQSALLKHEVAYVLGQMQDAQAVEVLRSVLEDSREDAMVRHEAAEALGSIADPSCLKLLEAYSSDPEPIVADSCVVALDMLKFEQSGDFQYVAVA